VIIVRTSPFTGKVHQMEIPVTYAQIKKWQEGMNIQDAMPNLTPEQREFIKTGIPPHEWPIPETY